VLNAIGTTPAPHEPQPLATLRDQLIWQAVCYGEQEIRQLGENRFKIVQGGGAVHPDLMRSTLQIGAAVGGGATLEWFKRRFDDSDSEHHRMDLLSSMGAFTDTVVLEEALAFCLADVPDRNRFLLVAAVAANPAADNLLWRWYLDSRETLEKGHPLLYERMLIVIILAVGLTQPDAVRAFFLEYRRRKGAPVDAIDLALAKLGVNLRLRAQADGCETAPVITS
jgi:hypothetical protein